jgi:hypothetical protein
MDGVLADFNKRYKELFGTGAAGEDRDRKNFSKNWKEFIRLEQFATLDTFPGKEELYNFVSKLPVRLEILSSTGGIPFHSEVSEQKSLWLKNQGIDIPKNFVPGRKVKKYYAFQGNLLIDDTPDVVEAFNDAGGIAILHKDVNETISKLKELIDESDD